MPPEEIGKKFCRLDINMVVDDKRINLEITPQNPTSRILTPTSRALGFCLQIV